MLFVTYIASSSKRYLLVSEMPDKVVLEAAALRGGSLPVVSSLIVRSRDIEVTRAREGRLDFCRRLYLAVRSRELRSSGPLDIRWRALSMESVLSFLSFARKRADIRLAYKLRAILRCARC